MRQTKNKLTGEHYSIMVRALPKTSGVDDMLHGLMHLWVIAGGDSSGSLQLFIDDLPRTRSSFIFALSIALNLGLCIWLAFDELVGYILSFCALVLLSSAYYFP
jgi:hypothetical protein